MLKTIYSFQSLEKPTFSPSILHFYYFNFFCTNFHLDLSHDVSAEEFENFNDKKDSDKLFKQYDMYFEDSHSNNHDINQDKILNKK